MTRGQSAIVLGAGIIGTTSAYALAKAGWKVTLIDARDGPALGASFGNGRQLSYSHTDALASPHLLPKLPAFALGMEEAFRLKLKSDPALLGWFSAFLSNCTARKFQQNTLANLALAERSRDAMEMLLHQHDLQFDRRKAGKLVLYHSAKEFERASAGMAVKVSHGSNQRALSKGETLAVDPALAQCNGDLVGAIHSPDDETGNCTLFASQLLKLSQREYGVNFMRRSEIDALHVQGDTARVSLASGETLEADMVVACLGHTANQLLAPIGHRLPVLAMKGYSFTAPKGKMAPTTSITDNKRRIVFTDIGDEVLVAGIADLGDDTPECGASRLASMKEAARTALPDAADYDAAENFWTGHRPVTPNSQPITKRVAPSLAINTGHGMLGWTLAMGSAAELIDQLS